MKLTMIALMIFALGQFGIGQKNIDLEETTYRHNNVLKLSPIELGRAEFQIGYERYFKNRSQSIVVLPSIIIGKEGLEEKSGYQLMMQYRFYLSQLQRETNETLGMYNIGFYAAPYLLGMVHEEDYTFGYPDPETFEWIEELRNERTESVEGGALMGIQLDITKRIVFDLFVGGGIRKSNVRSERQIETVRNNGIFDTGYTGIKPRIGMQIGITF